MKLSKYLFYLLFLNGMIATLTCQAHGTTSMEESLSSSGNTTISPHIEKLPIEVQIRIIEHLEPKDIFSVLQVSSKLYPAAQDVLIKKLEELQQASPIKLTASMAHYMAIHKDRLMTYINLIKNIYLVSTLKNPVTIETIRELTTFPYLTTLTLYQCNDISDKDLESLPQTITKLSFRKCNKIAEKAFFNIMDRFPNLVELSLSGCHKVTDIMITRIFTPKLQHLTILDLSDTDITDTDLRRILLLKLPSLITLKLQKCNKLLNLSEELRNLATEGYLPQLETLQLPNGEILSGEDLNIYLGRTTG